MNVNKNEAKRLDELVAKMKERQKIAIETNKKKYHTGSVMEVNLKDFSDMLYYLDMLREELNYRVDHYTTSYTQLTLPGFDNENT